MTTAVLLATAVGAGGGGPAALMMAGRESLVARMASQAREAGADDIIVIAQPAHADVIAKLSGASRVMVAAAPADELEAIASIARTANDTLLIADASYIGHDAILARTAADPRVPSAVLGADEPSDLRVEYGRAVSAGSSCHEVARPTNTFAGVLKLNDADRWQAAAVADNMAARVRHGEPWSDRVTQPVLSLLLVGLLRSGVAVPLAELRDLVWRRARSQSDVDDAHAAMDRVSEDDVVLRSAVKSEDGFFTTFFVSPYSRYVARLAANAQLTPNQVTVVSLLVGLVAALAFAGGNRFWLIVGAILLQVSFVLDCVDGQLARYTLQFSARGAWLDAVFDRTKEVAVFAGLAAGGVSLWTMATLALLMQVFRHTVDFSYAANLRRTEARVLPIEQRADERAAGDDERSLARSAVGALARSDARASVRYLKRSIAFPIGERFAVISLVAAVAGAREVFIVMLAWGAVATVYTLSGRTLRSVA